MACRAQSNNGAMSVSFCPVRVKNVIDESHCRAALAIQEIYGDANKACALASHPRLQKLLNVGRYPVIGGLPPCQRFSSGAR